MSCFMLSTNSKSFLTENTFHAKFTQSKICRWYISIILYCLYVSFWWSETEYAAYRTIFSFVNISRRGWICVKTNLQNLLYDLYFHFLVNWNQQSKNRLFPLAMTLRRGLSAIYKQRRSTAAWPHPRRNFRKTSKAIDTSIGLFRSVYITFF